MRIFSRLLLALAGIGTAPIAQAQDTIARAQAAQAAQSVSQVRAALTGSSVASSTVDRSFTATSGSQLLVGVNPERTSLTVCDNGSSDIAVSIPPRVLTSTTDAGAIRITAGSCYSFASPPRGDVFVYATAAVALTVQEGSAALADGTYSKRTLGAAARLGTPINASTGLIGMTCRTRHYARSDGDITDLSLVYPGWYHSNSGVIANPNQLTLAASVEYPAGIIARATFGGATSTTLTPGTTIVSDATNIRIKAGAAFWVRTSYTVAATSNVMPTQGVNAIQSGFDSCNASATAAVDVTAGGGSFNADGVNGGTSFIAPSAILATTTAAKAVAVVADGDSILFGQGETGFSAFGAQGWVGRLMDNVGVPYTKIGRPGTDAASIFASPYLADYMSKLRYSHVLMQVGTNDITNGTPVDTIVGNYGKLLALAPGKTLVFATILPRTNSTDSWATSVNQTQQTNMARAVTLNQRIRTFGYGVIDAATAVSPSLDANVWTGATPPLVGDGTHPSSIGAARIANDNAVQAQARAALQ